MTTFEGYDFGELLDALGIGASSTTERGCIEDEDRIAALRDMLDRNYSAANPDDCFASEGHNAIQDMREWLDAFNEVAEKTPDHAEPLFVGLAEVGHDWTFARYFCLLMAWMWR